ncbi:MAG: saccharopine dehydrogenase family protein [Gammaproteobacteria bacterium]
MNTDFPVLIAGGSGVFGSTISRRLARTPGLTVYIGARHAANAKRVHDDIAASGLSRTSPLHFDIDTGLADALDVTKARLLINATGPFQNRDYAIPRLCIARGVSYIDIADARDYVVNISSLEESARKAGVSVISGASTVPGLSSTVVQHLAGGFDTVEHISVGISPGNRSPRGLATVSAILSYVGKPIPVWRAGRAARAYGWQGLLRRDIAVRNRPKLRKRWFALCDVADADLLPEQFPGVRTVEFRAGLELGSLHLGLWLLSWLVRAGMIASLSPRARLLLGIADRLKNRGSDRGAMFVEVAGKSIDGQSVKRTWQLIAESASGPSIPAIPAVVLARRLALGEGLRCGAYPGVNLFSLQEFAAEVSDLDIGFEVRSASRG